MGGNCIFPPILYKFFTSQIFPYFNLLVFSFHISHSLCFNDLIDFILHVAFTLLSHLILPLAKGAGGCSVRRDIDENAFISQSNVVGVYGEGFDKLKVKKKKHKVRKQPSQVSPKHNYLYINIPA